MQLPQSLPPTDGSRRVLLADDDVRRRGRIHESLLQEGYHVECLGRIGQVVDHIRRQHPDLILLSGETQEGVMMCGDIRMIDDLRLTPVILLNRKAPTQNMVVTGLMAGADDVVGTSHRMRELMARVRVQLRNRRDRELLLWARQQCVSLQDAALTDPLTGLANRRAVDIALSRVLSAQQWVVVCLVDVDHFKRINDTHGHLVGDQVLQELGRVLIKGARANDLVGRIGGEEFLVLCEDVQPHMGAEIAERIRHRVSSARMPLPEGKISVSVGAVEVSEPDRFTPSGVVASADQALYSAKHQGRDRAVLWTPDGLVMCHRTRSPELSLGGLNQGDL